MISISNWLLLAGAVEGAGAGAVVGGAFGLQQGIAADLSPWRTAGAHAPFPCSSRPVAIGPAGTKTMGRWPNRSAPISRPGTILSHTPSISAASKVLCESATAVPMAMASRENSDSSMPALPCVMPSHIAGTPPCQSGHATHLRAAASRITLGIPLVRLVGRQHVVVRGDDAEIRRMLDAQLELVVGRQRGVTVRRIRARHARSGPSSRWPARSAPDRRRGLRGCRSTMRCVTMPTPRHERIGSWRQCSSWGAPGK